jgi:hypothetical protein
LGSPEKKRFFYFTVRIFTESKCKIFPIFSKSQAIKKQGKEKKMGVSEQPNATGPVISG